MQEGYGNSPELFPPKAQTDRIVTLGAYLGGGALRSRQLPLPDAETERVAWVTPVKLVGHRGPLSSLATPET